MPAESARSGQLLVLLPGLIWGMALFVSFGFLLEPRPETLAQLSILFFLSAFAGLVHAGLFAATVGLVARAPVARRLPWTGHAAIAVPMGVVYAWLGLSIVKFSVAHAHLRFEDLWFIYTSFPQAAGEGTRAERLALALAVFAPLAVALLLFGLLRAAMRRASAPPVATALLIAALGGVGYGAVCWRYPAARWAATTLLPDSRALASGWNAVFGPRPGEGWQPDPARHARLDAPRRDADPAPWNVVVLMLESIPWQRFEGADARPESTPHLLALAGESILFERAYATSTHSDYAQTSILAALFPRKWNRHDYFTELDYPRALPWDVLQPLGRRTAVFSTQNESWGNMIAFLRTPALGTLRHAPDFPGAPRRGEGSETKIFESTVVDAFLDWLARDPERPFAAYLNFQATHYPYVWPDSFAPPYGPAPLDFDTMFLFYPQERTGIMLDRFHNALAYVDHETGRLRAGLERAGVWERTALLVVADHGEAFYEHGLPTHGTTLFEEQVRVPMFLRLPGAAPRRITEPVSVIDALPALYRAMGVARGAALQGRDDVLEPGYTGSGRPLFFTIQGLTREDGVLADGWKWIVNYDRSEAALFDLANDPGERVNLVLDRPERARALDAVLVPLLADQLGYYRARAWELGWGPPRLP